jgi:hypothetical protein
MTRAAASTPCWRTRGTLLGQVEGRPRPLRPHPSPTHDLGTAALAPRVVPESRAQERRRPFDTAGAVTLTGGLLLLIFTLGEAARVGWALPGPSAAWPGWPSRWRPSA